MALQLVLGSSGSGKTKYLYDTVIHSSVEHPSRQFFFIVPEQFTMQAQKDIVTEHPQHGTMNIDIVSFQRLAYRIFEELAVENLQVLDDMGKSMVLRKVAAAQRRKLVLFSGHLSQAGFVSQMKSQLSEFYQYGITPDILREMAPLARSPLLRQKLEDLVVVFQGFQEYIEGHYITTEEVLDVLCKVLPQSELIKNSVIALDGYTGFTPVQYRLIGLFIKYARQVTVTVTADPEVSMYRSMGMQDLFYMSRQMVCKLTELAEKNGTGKQNDIVLKGNPPPRFLGNAELAFLERRLFRRGRGSFEGEPGGSLELYQAVNPSGEVAHVVHKIQQFVKEEGLRYRDMAVVTGDLNGYGKEIAHQFAQGGIPVFLDDKKNVLDNPMVELIRSALEAVQKDFAYESVFRFLRTGLAGRDREMADRLENYVVAMGIRGGKRWRETWERTYRGAGNLNLAELNAYKGEALAPLFAMQDKFRQEGITIAGMAAAVQEMLVDCHVEEQLKAYQEYFTDIKELRLAKEYGQVYGLAWELLERLSALLGREKVGRKEFMEILDAGFAEISVGVIPASVDRVVVGDITRTRLAHVKVLFFVGVNDGIIPQRRDGGSLLTDKEREFFGEHQLELAPTAREDSFQQRFYLYLMMTKPSEKLIVSFAGVGSDGKSRRMSYLIGELKKMFPALTCMEQSAGGDCAVYSVAEARQKLICGLRKFRDGELEDVGLEPEELEPVGLEPEELEPMGLGPMGLEPEGLGPMELEPEGLEPQNAVQNAGGTPLHCGDLTKEQFFELYRFFYGSEEYRKETEKLVDAAFYVYEKQGIGHAVARALYGSILSGSVTRLEQYAACAYGHFLKYGLELMERQRFELAAADIGNLFHDSIDLCFRKVKEEGGDWRAITDGERERLVRQCVEQVTAEYGNTILSSSSRNAYLARRVEHITQRTVWALQQQILRGDFNPAGFEVSFSAADNLGAMKISLSEDEELHLRGRVDRVDFCEDGEQVYVKIIDYKSGGTSFDLLALYYGLQLQLVVYMDAVMEMAGRSYPEKEVVPAGILYYNIADPLVEKGGQQDQEAINAEILRELKMNGLINSELNVIRHMDNTIEKESDIIPVVLKDGAVQEGRSSVANRERFGHLRRYVRDKLKCAGREILDGENGVEPYKSGMRTACDYCPYHAVCGFDKKTSGYEYRRWKNRKSEEIWEELCREDQ